MKRDDLRTRVAKELLAMDYQWLGPVDESWKLAGTGRRAWYRKHATRIIAIVKGK